MADKMLTCGWCKGAGYFPNKLTMVGSLSKVKKDCNVCNGKGSFPVFSDEDKSLFRMACIATWDAIGPDIIELTGKRRMPVSHMVEAVLDADYMDMYGTPHKFGHSSPEDLEARKVMINRMKQIRYSGKIAE